MKNDAIIMLCFDLPNDTKKNQREYRYFIKELKKKAYIFFQKSIYIKYLKNSDSLQYELIFLDRISPAQGSIILFYNTFNRFVKANFIRGEKMEFDKMRKQIINI